jgi:hypothetical protein
VYFSLGFGSGLGEKQEREDKNVIVRVINGVGSLVGRAL